MSRTPATLITWQEYAKAPDPAAVFRAHFASLAQTPECGDILRDLSLLIDSIEIADPELIFLFQGGELLSGWPPADYDLSHLPPSYQTVLKLHNGLTFPDDKFNLSLNGYYDDGETISNFNSDYWDPDDNDPDIDPEELIVPFDYHSDWIAFHPKFQSPRGEPALAVIDHGNGELEEPPLVDFGVGGVLLRLLGNSLLGDERCRFGSVAP